MRNLTTDSIRRRTGQIKEVGFRCIPEVNQTNDIAITMIINKYSADERNNNTRIYLKVDFVTWLSRVSTIY